MENRTRSTVVDCPAMSFVFVCWQMNIRNTNQLSWAINKVNWCLLYRFYKIIFSFSNFYYCQRFNSEIYHKKLETKCSCFYWGVGEQFLSHTSDTETEMWKEGQRKNMLTQLCFACLISRFCGFVFVFLYFCVLRVWTQDSALKTKELNLSFVFVFFVFLCLCFVFFVSRLKILLSKLKSKIWGRPSNLAIQKSPIAFCFIIDLNIFGYKHLCYM